MHQQNAQLGTVYMKPGLYKSCLSVKSRGSNTFTPAYLAILLGFTSRLRFWIAELKHLNFKKNPDEKYFFIMEKIDFEKKSVTFFKIPLGETIFPL